MAEKLSLVGLSGNGAFLSTTRIRYENRENSYRIRVVEEDDTVQKTSS